DEPTTALDVTVAAQVLTLLATLQRETDAGLLLITHDFGVVARIADDVIVMHDGRAVERAPVAGLFDDPRDPYTVRLLNAVPRIDGPMRRRAVLGDQRPPVLTVRGLSKTYGLTSRLLRRRTGEVRAVNDVSFDLAAGETLAIVGESGSGKSTTLHEIMGFAAPPGTISVNDMDPATTRGRTARALRQEISMVFQDPAGALDPRMTAHDIVAEPLRVAGRAPAEAAARVTELFTRVGLDAGHGQRFPRAFSGGQRQRLAIARALATEPSVIALDEPLSALDVSIQADILELLCEIQDATGVAYLLVAHDLAVVRKIAHRVAVMQGGEFVEIGPVADVFERPQHPYTRQLIAAVPPLDPRRARIEAGA
ncbi:ATP-binding cassette domain-containing protein, partial [Gordonia sp. UBA5067]